KSAAKEEGMQRIARISTAVLVLLSTAVSQNKPSLPLEEQTIRISTALVQLDVVVTDKSGAVVRGLTKNDFELYEGGKKQLLGFFESVDASNGQRSHGAQQRTSQPTLDQLPTSQGPSAADIGRIFAFVVDDLTTRYEDLTYLRQMLTNFVDSRMQPSDLVAIVRTVGGKGLLQ